MRSDAIDLLAAHIHALPHPSYGVINMLPFAHDSDEIRALTRNVCEAVVDLLEQNGYLKTDAEPTSVAPVQTVSVRCRLCDETLVTAGQQPVDAVSFIAGIANLNPACPHPPLTLDDMRRHMEREWGKALIDDEAI